MRRAIALAGLAALAAGLVCGFAALWHTTVPGDLRLPGIDARAVLGAGAVERAQRYQDFAIATFVLSTLAGLVALALYARRGPGLVRKSAAGPLGTGFLLAMLGSGIVWVTQLPFELADLWWARRHHVIETGYLDTLLGGWAGLGGRFLVICLTVLIAMGFGRLLRATWWVPTAVAFTAVTLLLAFVTPWLLTGQHAPRRAALRADAARIAAREGVPDVPLRIEPIRDVTPSPNAYAVGLGPSRRVVLWDTITGFPARQVRVTIAHEYAHQARHHILKDVAWFLLIALPGGLVVALVLRRRGGFVRPEVVPLVLLVVALLQLAAMPLQSVVSRHYEAEADWRALNTTRDPAALIGLMRNFTRVALADPDPPGWYHWLADDHPSLAERVAMARAWAEREHVASP